MSETLKQAQVLCNTLLRNGYEAYVINARLHEQALEGQDEPEVDIAADMSIDELIAVFPKIQTTAEPFVIAVLVEDGVTYHFYAAHVVDGSHPDAAVAKSTDRLLQEVERVQSQALNLACPYTPANTEPADEGFSDLSGGEIVLTGIADETLKYNYILGIRAIRYAANYQLPVEANTWMAIIRGVQPMLDYVPVSAIMDEWRKVEAENLWQFVSLLFDCQVLHGLVPEIAALSRTKQPKGENGGGQETVLEHTIECMRRYPEELPYDWYGTMACLFHDVGKLYTAEYYGESWHFHQHHVIGAKITQRILNRLRYPTEDIDLICHLVRYHLRFTPMLTDKGIRRFTAIDEYPRLIEMARANIKARDGSYASFNHNMKYLERADVPHEMLEPLLNGNEIMEFAGIRPGPAVGMIRDALIQAQIGGDVTSVPEAVEFVSRYKDREQLT